MHLSANLRGHILDLSPREVPPRNIFPFLFATLLLLLAGCSGPYQINPTVRSQNLSLKNGDLKEHGMALITPSTVTGQEQDKQALALGFAETLQSRRPEIQLKILPETIGAINRNGLAERYRLMFHDYHDTGIFTRETLKEIGEITNSRYVAQLKLANFHQDTSGRLSLFGLRLVKTERTNIRLFLSIWDTWDGSIAWEGIQELNYAYDTFREKPVTFNQAVEEASKELIGKIP